MISLLLPRIPGLGIGGGVVVVAYVAILAAIAIPAYQDYLGRATLNMAMSDSAPYRQVVAQYAASHQAWPDSLEQLGLAPFAGNRQVSGITLGANGVLNVDFVNMPLRGHVLQLTPYVRGNTIHWAYAGDVPAKLLPPACHTAE